MLLFWNNIRYALRQLRRSPGFALTVVLTPALGAGAHAISCSVLHALILRPLPVPAAGQLVSLNRLGINGSWASTPWQSYPDYRDLRDDTRAFSGLAAYLSARMAHASRGLCGC